MLPSNTPRSEEKVVVDCSRHDFCDAWSLHSLRTTCITDGMGGWRGTLELHS